MIPRIERSKLAGMNCGEVAGHINMLRRAIGMEEIDFRTMKHSLDRLMNRYDRQWEYTRAVVIERKERAEKEKAMAKKDKKDYKKQTTKPAVEAVAPVEKKPEAVKPVEITDRMALLALAQVAGWEANDPFIGNSAEDTVTVESDSGETELKAMTEDQCKMELGENIGILTPEDQKAVEAMENGPAIWAKFVGLMEDLSKAKVEAGKKETKAAAKASDKAAGTEKPKRNPGGIKKAGGEGSPGVIGSIQEFVTAAGKKGITKDDILEKLAARFPDRDKAAMSKTIQAQLPNRMAKEKGIKIEAKKDGDKVLFIVG